MYSDPQCFGRKGTQCKQQAPPSFWLSIGPCFPEFGFQAKSSALAF